MNSIVDRVLRFESRRTDGTRTCCEYGTTTKRTLRLWIGLHQDDDGLYVANAAIDTDRTTQVNEAEEDEVLR
jgi:hypothetical protein